jgi:hypothetical protein
VFITNVREHRGDFLAFGLQRHAYLTGRGEMHDEQLGLGF